MPSAAVLYAREHMGELMREAVKFYLQKRPGEVKAVLDIVGYPHEGYNDETFDINTVIILDKEKSVLKAEDPWLGWEVSTSYKITGHGHEAISGCQGSRITSDESISEEGLMDYLNTGGNPLYRINPDELKINHH